MTNEELFNFTKKSLHVTSTAFDDEIRPLITAAIVDISESIDKPFDITNAVQCSAVALYCKGYSAFSFGSADDKLKAQSTYQDMLKSIGLRNLKGNEVES